VGAATGYGPGQPGPTSRDRVDTRALIGVGAVSGRSGCCRDGATRRRPCTAPSPNAHRSESAEYKSRSPGRSLECRCVADLLVSSVPHNGDVSGPCSATGEPVPRTD